jgi:hypothetical protein
MRFVLVSAEDLSIKKTVEIPQEIISIEPDNTKLVSSSVKRQKTTELASSSVEQRKKKQTSKSVVHG